MAAKSQKNTPKKSASKPAEEESKKLPSKAKKQDEDEDDDDELEEDGAPVSKSASKKAGKDATKKSKGEDEEDDEEGDDVDEVDDWDKVEEEEEWDPDFDEFDIPKSKVKKSTGTGGAKKAGAKEEDDFSFEDDEFKDMGLFNDSVDDDEDDF